MSGCDKPFVLWRARKGHQDKTHMDTRERMDTSRHSIVTHSHIVQATGASHSCRPRQEKEAPMRSTRTTNKQNTSGQEHSCIPSIVSQPPKRTAAAFLLNQFVCRHDTTQQHNKAVEYTRRSVCRCCQHRPASSRSSLITRVLLLLPPLRFCTALR